MGDCAFGGWRDGLKPASALLGGTSILPLPVTQRNKKRKPRAANWAGSGGERPGIAWFYWEFWGDLGSGAEAGLHEGLALVAFEGLGFGISVAGLHFALLRRGHFGLGAQAGLHEGFALVAFFAFSVLVAGAHLALLSGFGRGRRGSRRCSARVSGSEHRR